MSKEQKAPPARKHSLGGWLLIGTSWTLLGATAFASACFLGHKVHTRATLPVIDTVLEKVVQLRGHRLNPETIVQTVERVEYVPQPLDNAKVDENNPCVLAILMLAPKHGVPLEVALSVSKTESGFNPKAVNRNTNGSVDRGCMQVNGSAHPDAFAKPDDAFNARLNVDYGLRFLKRLHNETGDWRKAIRYYNSRNYAVNGKYAAAVAKNAKALNVSID